MESLGKGRLTCCYCRLWQNAMFREVKGCPPRKISVIVTNWQMSLLTISEPEDLISIYNWRVRKVQDGPPASTNYVRWIHFSELIF